MPTERHRTHINLDCSSCGVQTPSPAVWTPRNDGTRDPDFGLPLWLQTPCCGETLWATNKRHLAFLRNFVEATLRERKPNINSSLISRLPKWIKSAKNRSSLLVGLARLESRVVW